MKPDYKKVLVSPDRTIREGIAQLNDTAMRILLVVDEGDRLLGTVTDGDIRRGLLSEIPLTEPIRRVMFTSPRTLPVADKESAGQFFLRDRDVDALPIVTEDGVVCDIAFNHPLHNRKEYPPRSTPVFVLAGGKGTRLSPFTSILPKPLIPIGETPIVELIMQRWKRFGFNNFILSLNYKADMIRAYFGENPEDYELEFVREDQFLGTAGSLHLVRERTKETLMVSNCDVMIDVDFDDLYRFHKDSGNDATMIGVVRHVKIPYGVIQMRNGKLEGMVEKPEYEFVVNAGIYALEPSVVSRVQDGEYMDMPTLLEQCRADGCGIGVYPVSSEMVDVGHWDEFHKASQFVGSGLFGN